MLRYMSSRPSCFALLASLSLVSVLSWRPAPVKPTEQGVRLKVDSSQTQADDAGETSPIQASTPLPQAGLRLATQGSRSDAADRPSISEGFATWFDEWLGTSEPNRCQPTSGHGCKIGCRCSLLRVCLPKPHISPNANGGAHSEGICSIDASKIATLVGLVVFVGWLILKIFGSKLAYRRKVANMIKMLPIDSPQVQSVLECVAGAEATAQRRRKLEKQLRIATPMSVQQSQVLLGHFFNFDDDECSTKKRRREMRARLAAQREYHFDSIEMETLPPQETEEAEEAAVKKL